MADGRKVALVDALLEQVRSAGFVRVPAEQMRAIAPAAILEGWAPLAASWNDLGLDTYMADGGRYRKRRFSAFRASASQIERKPHQPHYQSRDYNALNGGIERWFLPISDEVAGSAAFQSILRFAFTLFDALTPEDQRPASWHVECHQFRIEALQGQGSHPTPEGLHRDGVDWVLVMLVKRENIAEGVTSIHDAGRALVGRFVLAEPMDATFVDDSRMYHGVTAVVPVDPARPAFRDVLVVTFRRE